MQLKYWLESLLWDRRQAQHRNSRLRSNPCQRQFARNVEQLEQRLVLTPLVVAVIDSGIDYTSPDLYLNIWLNQGEISEELRHSINDTNHDGYISIRELNESSNAGFVSDRNSNGRIDAGDLLADPAWHDGIDQDGNGKVDDLIGWDFTDNDLNPNDENGHGTHVSGILAATGNNSTGAPGVHWDAQIMVVKFLDKRLQGEATDAVNALNYVTQFRQSFLEGDLHAPDVRITNNSWEIRPSQSSSGQALNDAIAANAGTGMLLVAAAGNGVGDVPQNLDTDPFASLPAANPSPNIVSVAAVDNAGQLLVNSNYGFNTVDLAAPGLDILSTEPGGNHGTRTGTSMATPFVTGTAALFWSQYPEATAAEVRQAILNGVDVVPGLTGKVATQGRLNTQKTMTFDTVAPRATLTSVPDITSQGGTFQALTINYADNVAVNWSTLNAADIVVTRADGQPLTASVALQSTTVNSNAPQIGATYRVLAPNGKWTNADNGVYEVRWVADQVSDAVGNKNRAALLGTFTINIPAPDDLRVTSVVDSTDQTIGDGRIEDSQGRATLRAAIQEANSDPDANTIKLAAGTYLLTIAGGNEDNAVTGDLDLRQNVTIIGNSTATTIIDAGLLDRVFHVLPGITVTLKNLTLRNGKATDGKGGGGILNEGFLTLDHVFVTSNLAATGGGGGLLNNVTTASSSDTLTIIDSTFSGNTATGADGGGLKVLKGKASILNSTFDTNTAGTSGGGVTVLANTVTVTNSTFSANTAGTTGGGLQLGGGVLALTNTTVTLNLAATAGGGLTRGGTATARLVNTIVAGNLLTGIGTDVDVSGAISATGSGTNLIGIVGTATGFSASRGDLIGTGISPLNANLAPLADNGGLTKTHRPNVGSPAIDAGAAVAGLTTDQRGLVRTVNGDNTGGATTDIGSVEFVFFSTISGTAFYDLNQNGLFDQGEQTLSGWTIYLDANSNRLLDAGEQQTLTGSDGKYVFTNVPPGNYVVSEILKASTGQSLLPLVTQDMENFDSVTSPANGPPTGLPQSLTTNEDVPKSITLTGDDGDPEVVQTLTFAIFTQPSHGTLSGFNANTGAVTYTPNADYNGPDSFTFKVTDDNTAGGPATTSTAATISLTVSPVNDRPVANAQALTNEGVAQAIVLGGSDSDAGVTQALTFAIAASPAHGTLSNFNTSTGAITYTPTPGYLGSDSFTFTVTDDGTAGGSALTSLPATVTLTGTVLNLPPVAYGQTMARFGTDIPIYLAGDDGNSNLAQSLLFKIVSAPLHGYFSQFDSSTGRGIYVLNPGELVEDSFTFTITDDTTAGSPALTSEPATVRLTREFGNNAYSIATADLNGDANLDVVAANGNDGVSVLLENGDGTLQVKQDYATDFGAISVAIADVNGDGSLDLVTADPVRKNVGVLLGNGDGTFQSGSVCSLGSSPQFVTIADVNNDGKPDLITTNDLPAQGVSVLLGNGDGTFLPEINTALAGFAYTAVVVDLNGDGKADLAAPIFGSNIVSVLLGNGDGTFHAQFTDLNSNGTRDTGEPLIPDPATGSGPTSLVLQDVDSDGVLDILTANNAASVSILLGNGDGTFQSKQDLSTGAIPVALLVTDLSGDGKPDIVTANPDAGSLGVRVGIGDGTFLPRVDFPTGGLNGTPSQILAAADLNGDTKPDLITVDFNLQSVSVLLRSGSGYQARQDYAVGAGNYMPVAFDKVTGGEANYGVSIGLTGDDGEPGVNQALTFAIALGPQHGTLSDFDPSTGLLVYRPFPNFVGDDSFTFTVTDDDLRGGPAKTSLPGTVTVTTLPLGHLDTASAVAVVDLNGDGKQDLVTSNYNYNTDHSDTVAVLLGNGDGTFQTRRDIQAASGPFDLAVVDVNGDSKLDAIMANQFAGSVSVLLGNGDGTFNARQDFPVGGALQSVAVADINNDGKRDIVVANITSDCVNVLLGNGDGTFQAPQTFATDEKPQDVVLVDLNNDGKPDIVTANLQGANVSVLLGNGDGTFQPKMDFAAGMGADAVAVQDFNGDTKPDLAVANYNDATVSVLLGNGNGTFQAKQDYDTAGNSISIVIADVNKDNKPDLIAANLIGDSVSVLLGNGNGTFQTHHNWDAGSGPIAVAVKDVNGDTQPDIVAGNVFGRGVSVLLGDGSGAFPQLVGTTTQDSNHNPTAADASFSFDENSGPHTIALPVDDGDPGVVQTLHVNILSGPNHGTLSAFNPTSGTLTYTPDLNFDGIDSFVYVVSDDATIDGQIGTTPSRTVTLTIQPTAGNNLPYAVAVGDVNGDQKPDVVTANGSGNSVSVLLGNGDGTYLPKIDSTTGDDPRAVALGDLNGDGRLDLAAANFADGTVSVRLGNGDGTFQARQDLAMGDSPESVVLADVNADGKFDLITANSGSFSNSVSVRLGNGNGTFQASVEFATGTAPRSVTVVDVNADSKLDLVTANGSSNTVSVLLGIGNGTFQSKQDFGTGAEPRSLAAGDVNGDGKIDLITANLAGSSLSVLLGNGTGTFQVNLETLLGSFSPADLALTDTNGDGKLDVIAADGDRSVIVFRGRGNGYFGSRQQYSTEGAVSVVAADVDGNGQVDLVTANVANQSISVLLDDGSGLFQKKRDFSVGESYSPGATVTNPGPLVNVDGTVFFAAGSTSSGVELWKSNGTAAGTVQVKDARIGTSGSNPNNLTNVNGTLYFTADNGIGGLELWRSNGTDAGTSPVKDIFTGAFDSNPSFLTNVNGTLFFAATDGPGGTELWKSNGTSGGTVRVKDIVAGAAGSNPSQLTNVNGTLFFVAFDTSGGWELWKSDGSSANTVRVKDINAGTGNSNPNWLTNVNGTLYFTANDGVNGTELWKSDGTTGGTVVVKDIVAGSGSSNPAWLTNANGTLIFTVNNGGNGTELWKSDGTALNTVLVRDIVAGPGSSQPDSLVSINGEVYFTALDLGTGRELWKTDGSFVGTVPVKDIIAGSGSSNPGSLTVVNGMLYFTTTDGVGGRELWKSDGTVGGTTQVQDISPGAPGSFPASLTDVNGVLYFSALDVNGNWDLWKSDGTGAGTVKVKSVVNPAPPPSNSASSDMASSAAGNLPASGEGNASLVNPPPGGPSPAIPNFPDGWTISGTVPWVTVSGGSSSDPIHAFIPDSAFASESYLTSPTFTIALQDMRLTFQNSYNLDTDHDGGMLEVSVNGGEFSNVVSAGWSFVLGSYQAGASVMWTGDSGGYVETWLELPNYEIGTTIQLRWHLKTDASIGATGWSIDTIELSGTAPGWTTTFPTQSAVVPGRHAVTVAPGATYSNLDFGNYASPGKISGQVALDINGDGFYEQGLPDWTVFIDENENRLLDPEERSVVTASDGTYVFTNIPPLFKQNVIAIAPLGWEATTFAADISVMTLPFEDAHRFYRPELNQKFGAAVSSAGDVNGDGYDDLLISMPYVGTEAGSLFMNSGSTFVIFGRPEGLANDFDLSSLDGANGFVVRGADSSTNSNALGSSIAAAGDINHDGFDDILIGAPLSDAHGTHSGATYVIFGKASGFAATLDLLAAPLNGTNGFVILGDSDFDGLGATISGVGDVNADGFDDIVVVAPGADSGGPNSGAAYLIFGRNTQTSPFSAQFQVSSLNGSNGVRLDAAEGESLGNEISASGLGFGGPSVAGAGDINGDGFADFVIGTKTGLVPTGSGPATERRGKAYVVLGKSSGWGSTLNLAALDGTSGFVVRGAAKDDEFGISVAGIGDFNGDHFDDILIGSDHADPHGINSGASYVLFGKDTHNSPFPAAISAAALNGPNGFRISGVSAGDASGVAVSAAGDINGDGLSDLIIGASHVNLDQFSSDAGAAYVVLGSMTGFNGNLDLSTLNGHNGFRLFDQSGSNSELGFSVSGAGDINGDGLADILIGGNPQSVPPSPNGNDSYFGSAFLVLGRGDNYRPITLDAAENRTYVDFPVQPKSGEIHGQVFDDKNRNGFRDAGELGVAGITLLLDLNGNDAKDNDEPTAQTDSNGQYVFANLPAFIDLAHPTQQYRVVELVSVDRLDLVQSLPQRLLGAVDVTPFVANARLRTGYDIAADGQGGFLITGTDGTSSGFNQQDVLRVSADGQTVTVFSAADHPQGITSDGTYAYWVDLDADDTHTRVYRQLLAGGTRELVYSSVTPAGTSNRIISATGLDFVPGSGSGTPGSLLTVDALQGQITRVPTAADVADDDLGSIGLPRLPGLLEQSHAQYLDVENGVIYVVDPGHIAAGSDHSHDLEARILSIPLAGGSYTVLFTGDLPEFDLYDTTIDASRPRGIAVHGGTVYVSGEHAIYALPATGGTPQVVAADERFEDLAGLAYSGDSICAIDNGTPGKATVWRVDLSPQFQRSIGVDVSTNERTWTVTLTPGEIATGFDFARFDPNAAIGAGGSQSIRGVVFTDQNGNGVLDDGEVGRPNVTVFLDLNRNGVLDAGDVTTVTVSGDIPDTPRVEPSGEYSFTGLGPGLYDVLLADSNLSVALTTSREVALSPTDLGSGPNASTGTPRAVAIGDWNNDGLKDLVVADSETGKVTLWKNTGDQLFESAGELNVGGIPNSVTLLNLDADTLPDLAIGQAQFGSISLWKNLGNGQFEQQKDSHGVPQSLVLSSLGGTDYGVPSTVASMDLNQDSRPDLVVVDAHPDHPRVFVFLRNTQDFKFAAPQILATPSTAKGLVTANLNGDTAPDIAVTIPATDQVLTWLNLNNGSAPLFASAQPPTTVEHGPTALALLQADGQGGLDLAVATADGRISILKNNGNGSWTNLTTLFPPEVPTALQAADIDGLYGPDLVVALGDGNDSSQPLIVYYHSGDNTQPYPSSVGYGASIFDFNGVKTATGLAISADNLDTDNDTDLVVLNSAAKTVSVLRNGPMGGGQTVRLTINGTSASATDINFGIGARPTISFNPITGQLTITLLDPTDIELGSRGTQVELRIQGVIDDSLNVAAADVASIVIQGSSGADRIDLSQVSAATGFTHAGGVSTTLNGNDGPDIITGSGFIDHINGGDGADVLDGRDGDDLLNGGAGDDYLFGGPGNDNLDGQAGANRFEGGPGTNTLLGGHINSTPSFVAGEDVQVLKNSGSKTVTGWATNISAGLPDEASQVINFLVSNDNPNLFSTPPAITASGTLTFTPANNALGTAVVMVRIHDNGGTAGSAQDTSASQTFLITVAGANTAPTATPQSASTNEGTAKNLTLGGTDGDPDVSQTLTFAIVTNPAHGVLSGFNAATGQVTYTPTAGYIGPDSFTFQVTDDNSIGTPALTSAPATVSLTVNSLQLQLNLGGPAATWIKKQPPVAIVPQITVVSSGSLAGGTLSIDTTAAGKKKILDAIAMPNATALGTSTGLTFAAGHAKVTVQLNANVTAAAIESFLRGLKFSTKGAGVKLATRQFKITLTTSDNQSTSATQTINVRAR